MELSNNCLLLGQFWLSPADNRDANGAYCFTPSLQLCFWGAVMLSILIYSLSSHAYRQFGQPSMSTALQINCRSILPICKLSLHLTISSVRYVLGAHLLLTQRPGAKHNHMQRTYTDSHTSLKKNLREFSISSSPSLSQSACGEHWHKSRRRERLLGDRLWLPW